MTSYLNPEVVQQFNVWQGLTPDIKGISLEEQKSLLMESNQFRDAWTRYEGKNWGSVEVAEWMDLEVDGHFIPWMFFFMSLYEVDWYYDYHLYYKWIRVNVLDGREPEFGLNGDMVLAMIHNYASNFTNPFRTGGFQWWPFNFVERGDAPTYPLLIRQKTQREFEGILNWINENPLEVKQ
tara:strand:- start:990 stop:1529 length:540 start_codon:yes stop_codon:yes gene_type:complete